jgi:hypothetical protein
MGFRGDKNRLPGFGRADFWMDALRDISVLGLLDESFFSIAGVLSQRLKCAGSTVGVSMFQESAAAESGAKESSESLPLSRELSCISRCLDMSGRHVGFVGGLNGTLMSPLSRTLLFRCCGPTKPGTLLLSRRLDEEGADERRLRLVEEQSFRRLRTMGALSVKEMHGLT